MNTDNPAGGDNVPSGPPEACVNCGTLVPADAKECPRCGVRRIPLGTSPPPTQPMGNPYGPPTYPAGGYGSYGSAGYGPGPYPPNRYPMGSYAPVYAQTTNNKAIVALVLGIVGLLICQIASIFAIVVGGQATREIRYSGGRESGEGMALAGRILGWIGVGLLGLAIILIFAIMFLGHSATPN